MNGPTATTRRPSPWTWGGLLATTAALGIAVAASTDRTLPPGTNVAGIDLAGHTPESAREILRSANIPAPQVTVRAGQHNWIMSAAQLGWQVDEDATIRNLQRQTGNVLERATAHFRGQPQEGPLVVSVDQAKTRTTLDTLTSDLNRPAQNAQIYFDTQKRQYAVKADVPGVSVNTESTVSAFIANPTLTQLDVPLTPVQAGITTKSVQPFVDEGNRLMRPLTLKLRGTDRPFVLSPTQVANLYWVRPQGIELDHKTIAQAVDRANQTSGQQARNARFVPSAGQLVPVREQDGLSVKREEAIALLRAAVLQSDTRVLELPAQIDKPTLTVDQLPDPASLTVIATGSSNYKGSSQERATNVSVAARKLTGYVVPAGETFSFLDAVGRINGESGYASALVISGGRTVEGIGGGVCQVSTTAFRALYSAGLPVVERNQHAYRVRWYEPHVGFEAAVYDPGVDLRMKNDTGGPLLVRTFNNPTNGKLEVRLYGVPQSRKVSVSSAVILSHTPAPPPQYVVNAKLSAGQRRQVDWAADGYSLYITRTITDATETRTEKLSTNYKPWRAVFEVAPTVTTPNPVKNLKPNDAG